jgi:hypothetical protein
MISQLIKTKRTLEERQELMRRIALCEQIWLNLFSENQQLLAKLSWEELKVYCQKVPFTFAIADILQFKEPNKFWFFSCYLNKVKILASYLVNGNTQLEENLSDDLKLAAEQKALKIISQHISNNL